MKPFRDSRVVVLVVYIVAMTDSRNIDSEGQFFGSLSIVGVGFVKIPPQFYEKGPFYV